MYSCLFTVLHDRVWAYVTSGKGVFQDNKEKVIVSKINSCLPQDFFIIPYACTEASQDPFTEDMSV